MRRSDGKKLTSFLVATVGSDESHFRCGKERFFPSASLPSATLRTGRAGVASLSFDYAQDVLLRNSSVSHRPNCAAGAVEVPRTTNEIDPPYLPGTVGILVLLGNLAKDAKKASI